MTTRWVVAALLAGLLVGGAAGAALTDGQAHTAPTDVGALADRKDKSYLLLLHEDETLAAKFTGAQMDSIVGEYAAWGRQLHTENRLVSAEKLNDDGGRWLSPGGTESAARTGDILSGFFVIRASNYEEALRIAGASPHLKYGGRIEVREIEQTRS